MKKCTECNIKKPLNKFYKDKTRLDGLQYKCKECSKIIYKKRNKKYYHSNKKYFKEYHKQWRKENKDKIREYNKQYNKENKDRIKLVTSKYQKQYNKENPHYVRWRSILHRTLKYLNQDKTLPTEETLGYSAIELKQHLDNLGMNWETHHIDHIINISDINTVAIGSDFDGTTTPNCLKDCSKFPDLWNYLLKNGYSNQDIDKISHENLLRLFKKTWN